MRLAVWGLGASLSPPCARHQSRDTAGVCGSLRLTASEEGRPGLEHVSGCFIAAVAEAGRLDVCGEGRGEMV